MDLCRESLLYQPHCTCMVYLRGSVQNLCFTNHTAPWCTWVDLCRESLLYQPHCTMMYLRGSVQGIFTLPTALHHDVPERICARNLCFTNHTAPWCTWVDLCRESLLYQSHCSMMYLRWSVQGIFAFPTTLQHDVSEWICAGNLCFTNNTTPWCTWVDLCRGVFALPTTLHHDVP